MHACISPFFSPPSPPSSSSYRSSSPTIHQTAASQSVARARQPAAIRPMLSLRASVSYRRQLVLSPQRSPQTRQDESTRRPNTMGEGRKASRERRLTDRVRLAA